MKKDLSFMTGVDPKQPKESLTRKNKKTKVEVAVRENFSLSGRAAPHSPLQVLVSGRGENKTGRIG